MRFVSLSLDTLSGLFVIVALTSLPALFVLFIEIVYAKLIVKNESSSQVNIPQPAVLDPMAIVVDETRDRELMVAEYRQFLAKWNMDSTTFQRIFNESTH